MCREFVFAKANLGAVDRAGMTAMHWAAFSGTVDVVRCLIKYDAPVGGVDYEGKTPVHWAAERGDKEMVLVLLKAGGDAEAADKEGRRAVEWKVITRLNGRRGVTDVVRS